MGAERRIADRKTVDCINVTDLTSLNDFRVIARQASIVDASITGFLMEIDRRELVPDLLKKNLTLEPIVGQNVVLYLPQMNLDLDGTITRAIHIGRGVYHVAVEFSKDVPEYWRECLIDLLPEPGEIV
ncbi:MAG: hypothetical protein H6626_12595 [Pseudobdellovibrionaceae bacterium]|nr:hypothetical protein [Bdellovibrionales bacterium]USN47016.1 MAG: hypothetical protein H6626_12595 [Pseudobdellovibrionaceae bacterium]